MKTPKTPICKCGHEHQLDITANKDHMKEICKRVDCPCEKFEADSRVGVKENAADFPVVSSNLTPDAFQLLRFEESSIKGQKTKRFLVYSTHSDEFLGTIKWRNGWRCYVMSYEDGIDMSLSCEQEIIKFMRLLK